jgi:transcriptional regulator with XRE-family HTH domain
MVFLLRYSQIRKKTFPTIVELIYTIVESMSSKQSTNVKDFPARLAEALDTDEPAEISRRLGISYQAAKNYLEGRLPSAEVLIAIAEQSDYSLNWLLTGKGGKKVAASDGENASPDAQLTSELQLIVRRMVREEMAGKKGAPSFAIGGKREKKRA